MFGQMEANTEFFGKRRKIMLEGKAIQKKGVKKYQKQNQVSRKRLLQDLKKHTWEKIWITRK